MPRASRRIPHSDGSSSSSTSAIRLLVVGSHPGNLMPAALRIRLRPPSHPTRYCARQRLAVRQRDVDAAVVLREASDLDAVMDRHLQLADPAGQDALDVVLQQPEDEVVPGWEVVDERGPGEHRDLVFLSLRDEPIGDSTLIENLDGAREQTACARTGQILVGRRSTIATSTPANASSPASISPVGPPPAITTVCSVIATLPSSPAARLL